MRTLKVLGLLVIASAAYSASAQAQACLGLPSFINGSVHLNGAGEFPDSTVGYAVGIGAGRHNNLFANLGGGQQKHEADTGKLSYGFLEFGYQLPLGRAQLCPIAGGLFGVGPDDEANGIKSTSRAASAGVAVGLPLATGSVTVIPNAAIRFEYLSQKFEDEPNSSSVTDTYQSSVFDLGLGLVFLDRFSIQPLAHIRFFTEDGKLGFDENETSFGIFASVSFGWRAGPQ